MRSTKAVTFDCWSTLLHERDPHASWERRVEILARAARAHGLAPGPSEARTALEQAWGRHQQLWVQGVVSSAAEMSRWACEALAEPVGARLPEEPVLAAIALELAEATLHGDVVALDGARATLERLSAAGVRRALVCDTGFSPGFVVRRLLDRAGLLRYLEVTVFSDEAGVSKPHPRVFQRALAPLGLEREPGAALHVGDLRRTDVAGARGVGMGTVRIRTCHDDQSDLPDADHVVESHGQLVDLLGL